MVFLLWSALTTAMHSCKALTNAAVFCTVWSAGVITKIGSSSVLGPPSRAWKAARVKAGAVLRPIGSSNSVALILGNSRNWSKAKKRCSSLVTIKVGPKSISWLVIALMRSIASWNKLSFESPPDRTRNCLGKPERDKGQRRVPEPPQRITGVTLVIRLINPNFLNGLIL